MWVFKYFSVGKRRREDLVTSVIQQENKYSDKIFGCWERLKVGGEGDDRG